MLMGSFVQLLVTASVVGAVVFCFTIALRPVTEKLFSKTWHYYMGLVSILFFLGGAGFVSIPVRLAAFAVSAPVVQIDASAPIIITDALPVAATDIYVSAIAEAGYSGARTPYVLEWTSRMTPLANIPALMNVLVLAWAAGVALFFAVHTRRYLVYRKSLLRHSRVCTSVESPVGVVISRKATTPMIIGFIRPLIILPDIDFSARELDLVLAHELLHFKRKDLWLKLVILVVNAAHWFNPAAYFLTRYMNDMCELSCDEKVVMEMDAIGRKFYGETILSMLHHGTTQRSLICASGLCSSHKNIKRRLIGMLNVKKTRKFMVALSLALALVLTGIGGVVAYGLRADTDVDDTYIITTPTVILANEVINGNIIVDGSSLHLYGQINGVVTVTYGGSLAMSGAGQVNGTVNVYGNLYLSDSAVITGAGTRGVEVNHGGIVRMDGGYIRGNSYTGHGAGVWVNNGVFTMDGGYIEENTSNGGGGGVWISGIDAAFTLSNGYIRYNHSYLAGGGVFINGNYGDIFNVTGGLVYNNTVTQQ